MPSFQRAVRFALIISARRTRCKPMIPAGALLPRTRSPTPKCCPGTPTLISCAATSTVPWDWRFVSARQMATPPRQAQQQSQQGCPVQVQQPKLLSQPTRQMGPRRIVGNGTKLCQGITATLSPFDSGSPSLTS